MSRMFGMFLSAAIVMWLVAGQAPHAQAPQPKSQAKAATKAGAGATVDLNTATTAELDRLPGIGAQTAARIVEYRQKNGPFKKVEELMNVQGVGEKSFLKLKKKITVTASPEPAVSRP